MLYLQLNLTFISLLYYILAYGNCTWLFFFCFVSSLYCLGSFRICCSQHGCHGLLTMSLICIQSIMSLKYGFQPFSNENISLAVNRKYFIFLELLFELPRLFCSTLKVCLCIVKRILLFILVNFQKRYIIYFFLINKFVDT